MIVEPGEPLGDVPVLSDLVSLQYLRPERSTDLLLGNSDHHHPELVISGGLPYRSANRLPQGPPLSELPGLA
jgi:sarcosine oxidase, subunit beta